MRSSLKVHSHTESQVQFNPTLLETSSRSALKCNYNGKIGMDEKMWYSKLAYKKKSVAGL
jgi:hypothetical protein